MWKEVLNFSLKNGSTLVATQANVWQGSLTVEQAVSTEDAFEIGSTHIGQMTVTLADIETSRISNAVFSINSEGHLILDGERVSYQTVYANTDFTDAVVVVYMAQGDDDLQQMGVYNVVSAVRDEGTISITAYDNVTKLSVPYVTSLSFPSTYGAMASEICGTVMTFDGSTTAVATKPEGEDLTKREVLGYIAQACGYNVLCDNMGRFQFVRYNLSGFNTEGSYHAISSLYDFHHSQYPVVITGAKVIVVSTVDTTDPDTGEVTSEEVTNTYTSGTDDYQIVIEGNPLITTANGQAVADLIFATYGGVSFYTGTVSHISDLSIKASDIMKVTDRLGNTYPMLVSSTRISTGSAQNTGSYAEEPASKLSVQPTELSRVQNSVRQALLDARNSKNKANYASRIASNTNQYFWHTETGADTGAHITEIPREDFLADPTNGGGNLLARSNGVAVRDGLTELAQFGSNGVALYDGASSSPMAQFRPNRAVIGKEGFSSVEISSDGIEALGDDNNIYFQVAKTGAQASVVQKSQAGNAIRVGATAVNGIDGKTAYDEYPNIQLRIMLDIDGDDHVVLVRDADYVWGTARTQTYTATYDGGEYQFSAEYNPIDDTLITEVLACPSDVPPGFTAEAKWYVLTDAPAYKFGDIDMDLSMGVYGFAEGSRTEATGDYSHASGVETKATEYASEAHGLKTTASGKWQFVIGKLNSQDSNKAFIIGNGRGDTLSNALTVDWDGVIDSHTRAYEPAWETGHDPANYHCVVSAGICSFSYRGPAVAHANGTQIGTLPVGARPTSTVYCPCVKMGGGAVGCMRIYTTGVFDVMLITDTASTGRLYFNCSFPVV